MGTLINLVGKSPEKVLSQFAGKLHAMYLYKLWDTTEIVGTSYMCVGHAFTVVGTLTNSVGRALKIYGTYNLLIKWTLADVLEC